MLNMTDKYNEIYIIIVKPLRYCLVIPQHLCSSSSSIHYMKNLIVMFKSFSIRISSFAFLRGLNNPKYFLCEILWHPRVLYKSIYIHIYIHIIAMHVNVCVCVCVFKLIRLVSKIKYLFFLSEEKFFFIWNRKFLIYMIILFSTSSCYLYGQAGFIRLHNKFKLNQKLKFLAKINSKHPYNVSS